MIRTSRSPWSRTTASRLIYLLSILLSLLTIMNLWTVWLFTSSRYDNEARSATATGTQHRPVDREPSSINLATNFSGVIARPFEPWPFEKKLPCFEAESRWFGPSAQRTPTHEGLFFAKPYKTASSTAVGVHLRIARNEARRQKSGEICRTRFDHAFSRDLFSNRTADSFLWTVIRDPTERAVSQFFHFLVGRHKLEPTDENFRRALLQGLVLARDYYLLVLSVRPAAYRPQAANQILSDYDFIGITERLDESMVALKMLLNVPLADVLYLSAKHRGTYDDGAGKRHCFYIWPSFISSGMKEFFESDEWNEMVRYDNLLYQAANRSLDLTIERLGRPVFDAELARFRQAQQLVKKRCLPRAVFPCSEGGEYRNETDCLWNDSGCGFDCLDEVALELGINIL